MKKTTCILIGCNEPVACKRLCISHYNRYAKKYEDFYTTPIQRRGPKKSKKCKDCGAPRSKKQLLAKCDDCAREYNSKMTRNWQKENKDYWNAYTRKWRKNNSEKVREWRR